jgi:hypothetical protein
MIKKLTVTGFFVFTIASCLHAATLSALLETSDSNGSELNEIGDNVQTRLEFLNWEWWSEPIEVDFYLVVIGAITCLILLVVCFYLGYWRGSTIAIRTISLVALLVVSAPVTTVIIGQMVQVEIGTLDTNSAVVLCVCVLTLFVIEFKVAITNFTNRQKRETNEAQSQVMQTLENWIDVAFAEDGKKKLRKQVVRAIVTKDYPDGKILSSPSITWPKGMTFAQQSTIIQSVKSGLENQAGVIIQTLESEFNRNVDLLREFAQPVNEDD